MRMHEHIVKHCCGHTVCGQRWRSLDRPRIMMPTVTETDMYGRGQKQSEDYRADLALGCRDAT